MRIRLTQPRFSQFGVGDILDCPNQSPRLPGLFVIDDIQLFMDDALGSIVADQSIVETARLPFANGLRYRVAYAVPVIGMNLAEKILRRYFDRSWFIAQDSEDFTSPTHRILCSLAAIGEFLF